MYGIKLCPKRLPFQSLLDGCLCPKSFVDIDVLQVMKIPHHDIVLSLMNNCILSIVIIPFVGIHFVTLNEYVFYICTIFDFYVVLNLYSHIYYLH